MKTSHVRHILCGHSRCKDLGYLDHNGNLDCYHFIYSTLTNTSHFPFSASNNVFADHCFRTNTFISGIQFSLSHDLYVISFVQLFQSNRTLISYTNRLNCITLETYSHFLFFSTSIFGGHMFRLLETRSSLSNKLLSL